MKSHQQHSNSVNKQWALVTGGSKRIGAYINQQLALQGYNIVVHYNQSEQAAQALKQQLEKSGVNVILWHADLASPECLPMAIEQLFSQIPTLDLLINNASIFEVGSVLNSSLTQIQQHINVHLTSPWLLTQAFAKQALPNSQIINVLDANLQHNYTSKAAYFIAKKALTTLTELAAIECAPTVRVNAIAPGYVLTAVDNQPAHATQTVAEENAQEMNLLARQVPLADLFSAITLLMNNASLTGQIINIDGGSHLKCPPYMLKN